VLRNIYIRRSGSFSIERAKPKRITSIDMRDKEKGSC